MFTRLTKIKRQIVYVLLSAVVAIAITVGNIYLLPSPAFSASKPSPELESNIIDVEKFSDSISSLERKWQQDYEGYFQKGFANEPRSAKKIAQHLTDIRSKAGVNPAVIWAVPQDDFLRLMLITPDGQFVTKEIRGANQARLTARIEELEIAIGDRQSLEYVAPSRIIYSWLLEPLEPYLAAEKIDTLLLCTGPKLRSLPFAVLNDGEKFLIEKYNIASIPAFGLTDTSYEPKDKGSRKVLAMGASEFDSLPPLPGVEIEIDTIVSKLWSGQESSGQERSGQERSGQKIFNQDFTIKNLLLAHNQDKFDIIHIASHSKFSPGSPEFSYIQFSDRRLNLDRITDLKLDSPQVNLLVLSACETALGDEDAEFGFAGLAIQAGVKSALASLWAINDAGTVVLMSEFYQQFRSTTVKAEALRNAQVAMLKKKVFVEGNQIKGLDVDVELPERISQGQSQNFSHPFYWAGFTLIGNPW